MKRRQADRQEIEAAFDRVTEEAEEQTARAQLNTLLLALEMCFAAGHLDRVKWRRAVEFAETFRDK